MDKTMTQTPSSLLPLSFVGVGNTALVAKVAGSEDFKQHLTSLGFVEGAQVAVVSAAGSGFIVEVKGSQLAIDNSVALKIKCQLV